MSIEQNEIKDLSHILAKIEDFRVEAIYNSKYTYIKEIIWDTEANEKYGTSREGYLLYQNDNPDLYATFKGIESLRRMQTRDGKNTDVKYFIEEKLQVNKPLDEMFKLFVQAKEELFDILDVKDKEAFEYYLSENIIIEDFRLGANELKSRIRAMNDLIHDYNNDEFLKRYIDKIKG